MADLFTELMERMARCERITIGAVRQQMDSLLFAGNTKRFGIGLIGPSERNEVINQVCVALGIWEAEIPCE